MISLTLRVHHMELQKGEKKQEAVVHQKLYFSTIGRQQTYNEEQRKRQR